MHPVLPKIALTMGDPAGVGPEVCLRAVVDAEVQRVSVPVIFGDARILGRCAEQLGLSMPRRTISESNWVKESHALTEPAVLDLPGLDVMSFQPGVVSADTGAAGFRYVKKSIAAALAGGITAVATAPLNKEALRAAGIPFPGHTEIFAAETNAPRACMLQYSSEVTCSFVTVHVGYGEVPRLLSIERILDVIELTAAALRRIRGNEPKLAVLGLNPHAGEHGLFGEREEERIIIPAIEAARALGFRVEGPLPPDTAFIPAKRRAIDGFVCMYHDQGHIPLKALAFDTAVNATLGLPIVRTSVDHGTACDIAWRGEASARSLIEAVKLAVLLAAESV
jgi:4-hydroxythreonine-4-phosphate dehydrogenase